MPDARVPKLLVGSSSEGLEVAQSLKGLLEPEVEVQLWSDGFFVAGDYTLEALLERSRPFDGGLILGTADDRVLSRGEELQSIRDNLLLEFGLFVAIFGRRKAILALEGLGSTKLPSDLFGLTCVGFERTTPMADGLRGAATEIKRVAESFPLDVIDAELAFRLEGILRTFLADLQEAMGSAAPLGFHLWLVDQRTSPPVLVRIARSRTSPKAPLGKHFVKGEGIVGECWRSAAAVSVDFSEKPYRSIMEAEWREFGQSARRGMSFELLQTSRERYRLAGATPVISALSSGNRFLGCLSYNVGPNVDAASPAPNALAVEKVLDRVVEVVRIVLESQ